MSMSILSATSASRPNMKSNEKEDDTGVLWWAGHQYRLGGFRKSGQMRWRCRHRNCPGRLFSDPDETRSNKFLGVPHEHSCVERTIRNEFGYIPLDMRQLQDESSNDSTDPNSTSTPKRPKLEVNAGGGVAAQNLFEYEWPQGSGEHWFLQEQIMEYLDVKSFQRKYPDITRRKVDKAEREYLAQSGAATDIVADFGGLSALRSEEVIDLMMTDYPERYQLYQKVLVELAKQKEMQRRMELELHDVDKDKDTSTEKQAVEKFSSAQREVKLVIDSKTPAGNQIKADSRKMAELRAQALQQVSRFNKELNLERNTERRAYWDYSTMIIQQQHDPKLVLPAEQTKPVAHPCALIPGQYVEPTRKYSPSELRALPLSTVLDADRHAYRPRPMSPPPIVVTDTEVQRALMQQRRATTIEDVASAFASSSSEVPAAEKAIAAKQMPVKLCAMCSRPLDGEDVPMECHSCGNVSHVGCLDMSTKMYAVCIKYDWMCLECKPCSVCSKLDQEDKMIFCDVCDRGYHTFCVGMSRVPSGRWVCAKFCSAECETPSAKRSARSSNRDADESSNLDGEESGRSTPAQNLEPLGTCALCECAITKINKVHHRSKYRNDGICSSCARQKQANREPPAHESASVSRKAAGQDDGEGDEEMKQEEDEVKQEDEKEEEAESAGAEPIDTARIDDVIGSVIGTPLK